MQESGEKRVATPAASRARATRLLLGHGEEEIGLHADHERGLEGRAAEKRHRLPVGGEVEAVHGAGYVEVAVRVEHVYEALRE